jgi:hypothetical protein
MPDDIAAVMTMAELFGPEPETWGLRRGPRAMRNRGPGAIPPRLGKQVWRRAVLRNQPWPGSLAGV